MLERGLIDRMDKIENLEDSMSKGRIKIGIKEPPFSLNLTNQLKSIRT